MNKEQGASFKLCAYCGRKINASSHFCPFCGKKQSSGEISEEKIFFDKDEMEPTLEEPHLVESEPGMTPAVNAEAAIQKIDKPRDETEDEHQEAAGNLWKKASTFSIGDAEEAVKQFAGKISQKKTVRKISDRITEAATSEKTEKIKDQARNFGRKFKEEVVRRYKELVPDALCCICGKETKALSRFHLADDNYVCKDCMAGLPSSQIDMVEDEWDIDDVKTFIAYAEYSRDQLRPMFSQTNHYKGILLDARHGLFTFGTSFMGELLDDDALIYQVQNITRMEFLYNPNTYEEGFLHDKVTGDVLFELELTQPPFYFQKKLASGVSANAHVSGFINQTVTSGLPKDMTNFENLFTTVINTFQRREEYGGERHSQENCHHESYDEGNDGGSGSQLQMAMALFMYDSLDQITEDDLRKRRNKLIKSFHPDSGELDPKAAQKINDAYNVLKAYV